MQGVYRIACTCMRRIQPDMYHHASPRRCAAYLCGAYLCPPYPRHPSHPHGPQLLKPSADAAVRLAALEVASQQTAAQLTTTARQMDKLQARVSAFRTFSSAECHCTAVCVWCKHINASALRIEGEHAAQLGQYQCTNGRSARTFQPQRLGM